MARFGLAWTAGFVAVAVLIVVLGSRKPSSRPEMAPHETVILPGGGASKVAVELLNMRDAMYHAMTGEMVSGLQAAEWKLVNQAVPLISLKARVTEVAKVLLKKNPVALKATKDAVRRVREMTYDNAEDYLIRAQEDYLIRAQEAANSFDNEGRREGIRQFIDEKTYKPGLGAYKAAKFV